MSDPRVDFSVACVWITSNGPISRAMVGSLML
jgi:hypothetical protein